MGRRGQAGTDIMFRLIFIALGALIIACFLILFTAGSVYGISGNAVLILGTVLNVHLSAFYGVHHKKRAWLYGLAAAAVFGIFYVGLLR